MAGQEKKREPREVRMVRNLLRSMGVEDYDEHVVHQLTELLYRHVTVVASEACSMAAHRNQSEADTEDVKLAVRMRCEFTYKAPPGREVLQTMAREVNAKALPEVDSRAGLALPPAPTKPK